MFWNRRSAYCRQYFNQIEEEVEKIKVFLRYDNVNQDHIKASLVQITNLLEESRTSINSVEEECEKLSDKVSALSYEKAELKWELEEITEHVGKTLSEQMKMEILQKVRDTYSYEEICEKFPELSCLAYKK